MDDNFSHEESRIDLRVGLTCNNNCRYCCVGKVSKDNKTTTEIFKDLDIARKKGASKVSFTGGEPTIRKDIFQIIKKAKELKYNEIQIITNGRMLSSLNFFEKLVDSGVNHIAFSLDSLDEKIADYLSNTKGCYKQLMNAFENSKQFPNIMYTTITAINKLNYKELPEITRFLIKINKSLPNMFSEFMFLSIEGNVYDNKQIIPRYFEVLDYVKESLDISIKNKFMLNIEAIPPCLLENYLNHIVEFHMATERIMSDPGKFDTDYNNTRKEKLKQQTPKCRSCKYENICEGIHRNYYSMFGDEELIKR
jgi:radical SAM protein with 4Fe4S-binding SPASM domain